jgi:hypothetical protein
MRKLALACVLVALGCRTVAPAAAPPSNEEALDPRSDFRPTPWEPFSPHVDRPTVARVAEVLCGGPGPAHCGECASASGPWTLADCALSTHFQEDEESRELARRLLLRMGTVPGPEIEGRIEAGYEGGPPVTPALPVGRHKHHLRWVHAGLNEIDALFREIARHAPRAVHFRTRPLAIRFFKTEQPSYPSAYAIEGTIAYNLDGVLNTSEQAVAELLFHELFHLNDEGRGYWSNRVLSPMFDRIVARCRGEHDCLSAYAPDDATVPGGTYYAFDPRTGTPVEYGAEVGTRYFREQLAAFRGAPEPSPFKCRTPENAWTWRVVVDEFFGGFDASPPCD